MQNKVMAEWKILRNSKSDDFTIIIVIAAMFLLVIGLNVKLIFQMTSNQTEEIGRMQLESIRADFQDVLSKAEDATTQTAEDVQKILTSGAPHQQLVEFIHQRKHDQKLLTNGTCFNVYSATPDWSIIPDFNMPDDYHATERSWFRGALENPNEVFTTEPYIDAASGEMCFTMSMVLPDRRTVVGLDFNFSDVQESILRMNSDSDRTALIVNKYGMIIGYSDMSLVGEKVSRKLPEYEPILERVLNKTNHDSFVAEIDGADHTIFSSRTENGWYMILSVDDRALYKDSYVHLFITTFISLLMLVTIVGFYLNGVKNRLKAEEALKVKDNFLSNMSRELRDPLNRILKLSNAEVFSHDVDPIENAAQVHDSARKLSEMLYNLFSMSSINAFDKSSARDDQKSGGVEVSQISRSTRTYIILVLTFSMVVSMWLCINTTINWGDTKMNREVDTYEYQLSNWIEKQRSILSMFTSLIAERPRIMDDYESAVKLLNDLAKNYPEISACYMANPYKEHPLIMNSGWEGPPGWRVEQRPWYIETERSEHGFSVSAPYYDDQTGVYCVTISQVIYGPNDEFLGIFGIDFYLDRLITVLGESYSRNGYAFLVDRNGIIINHPNKDYEMSVERMTDVNGTEYQRAYADDEVIRTTDYTGTRVACLAKKNAASQFTVIVANNWWNIYGNIFTLGIAFSIFLLVGIFIVNILINRLLGWQQDVNHQLRESAATAVAAGQAKSQFFAQMSHEIRTPLNAVLGMNEMILRESDDRDIRDYALNIQSAGHTLLTLINSILDFSKLEEGKMKIVPVRYDTTMMIDDLVNMISGRARKKGLEFKTEIDPTLPKSLFGDDVRIKQVVTNILTNAVKYTREGSVALLINTEKHDADTIKLRISVRDTGIGIKPEDMDKLFQSFQRIDEEKNRNIEGTGLGISIVQRLLTMMGSELQVSSVYGEGSTFSFALDQRIIDQMPIGNYGEHHFERAQMNLARQYLKAPRARVMVVDDNGMNLKVMRGLLKANEIVPDLAQSGLECLKLVRKKKYDIIFLDHMMPAPDGIETLKTLRAEHLIDESTTVIALTANAVSGAREYYMKASFSDYLSKPIITDELEAILEKYLPKEEPSMENKEAPAEATVDDDSFSEAEKNLLAELCPWLDLEVALNSCMDSKEFFIEMLNDFIDDDKSEELTKFLSDGDVNAYKVSVHGLKSTSLIVGATELSEKAKALEAAAKDGDLETIKNNHGALLENYAAVRSDIAKWLEVTS